MVRRTSLTMQLLTMQVAIVLVTLLAAGALAVRLEEQRTRDADTNRVLTIARSLATVPSVQEAYRAPDPSRTLQPLAETVREAAGATFVVFTNNRGVRYSHPDPDNIGEMVSTDPTVPLSGAEFVGTETGSLGRSLRAKVPVRDEGGAVIGTVSVGILESDLSEASAGFLPQLAGWMFAAAGLGTLGAAVVTRLVRRRIFGLEPVEIAELLRTRDAMLHGIREGVVALDEHHRMALVNDEAMRLLGLSQEPAGCLAEEVLEPDLLALLGQPVPVTDGVVLAGERLLVVNVTQARVDDRAVGEVLTLRDRTELFDALRALQGQRGVTDALRAQTHEFSNHLHVISGLLELGCHEEAMHFVERVRPGNAVLGQTGLKGVHDASLAALLVARGSVARERGVALEVDQACQVPDGVAGDTLTVLGNLVDNAVEAAGTGGRVWVLMQADEDGLVLRVSDDGPGVPTELGDRIFIRGVTGRDATEEDDLGGGHHGRGIGLALVDRIARRRGGRVVLSDRMGGGAVFTVELPAEQVGPKQHLPVGKGK